MTTTCYIHTTNQYQHKLRNSKKIASVPETNLPAKPSIVGAMPCARPSAPLCARPSAPLKALP
jgi:hypothetical protein